MRWSIGSVQGLHRPTTVMITNNNDDVSKESTSTGPATAATTVSEDVFMGIDAAKVKQVVTEVCCRGRSEAGRGDERGVLVARIARLVKGGRRVHSVYEAGPTGFGLCRQIIALGATCLVVRAKRLDRHQSRRKHDAQDSRHLAEDLAAHHFGRTGLLVPVRVPTEEEELRRLAVRQRES